MLRRFPDWAASIPFAVEPVFLHGDFHFDNILYETDRTGEVQISGLFDFEWAWSGDSSVDLLHLEEAFGLYPEYEAPFLEGYERPSMPSEALRVYRTCMF